MDTTITIFGSKTIGYLVLVALFIIALFSILWGGLCFINCLNGNSRRHRATYKSNYNHLLKCIIIIILNIVPNDRNETKINSSRFHNNGQKKNDVI
ncbi:hypothetical protein BLOT_005080 [Blomia tropicalis]|nr:hypothetical protein BLOT_005080 [Blomia tropicalis]